MAIGKMFGALALGACFVGCDEVKISTFGYAPEDSTEFIQKAIDSGAKRVVFDRQSGPWVASKTIVARSNQELVFEDGVVLLAKRGCFKDKYRGLLWCGSITNVTIRGLGKGGTLRMWKEDYQDRSKYEPSEWRHALQFQGTVNVIVENMRFLNSGGDGICLGQRFGKPTKNMVVRNCVCDGNHRQGLSACSFDGLLIENCVLSNTKGTAPQAGIDIEPNNEVDLCRNFVMRNVKSFNNAGSGIEIMFHNGDRTSEPLDIRIESCAVYSNFNGTVVVGNHVRETNIQRGRVCFDNCDFRENKSRAIRVMGVPRDTLDVRFRDCRVLGSPTSDPEEVMVLSVGARQGFPDRVSFERLKVKKVNRGDWFVFNGAGVGPAPSAFTGDVEVATVDGTVSHVCIDRDWVKRHFKVVNGGKVPPPMLQIPAFASVKAVDLRPGEMVDLSPVALSSYSRPFVILMEKPGTVRLVARTAVPKGHAAPQRNVTVSRILVDGKREKLTTLPMPGEKSGAISFDVKESGFYEVLMPGAGHPSVVEKSNVPIAVDLTGWAPQFGFVEGRPFSFWFAVPGDRRVAFYANTSPKTAFSAETMDPSHMVFAIGNSLSTDVVIADLPASRAQAGLWSFSLKPVEGHSIGLLRVSTGNLPGLCFLAPEKYWK